MPRANKDQAVEQVEKPDLREDTQWSLSVDGPVKREDADNK